MTKLLSCSHGQHTQQPRWIFSGNDEWKSAGKILCGPASDWLGKDSAVIMQLYEVAN